MLICVCRQIDAEDFDSDEALKARVLQDDFQCGLCQMQYLMPIQSTSHEASDHGSAGLSDDASAPLTQ